MPVYHTRTRSAFAAGLRWDLPLGTCLWRVLYHKEALWNYLGSGVRVLRGAGLKRTTAQYEGERVRSRGRAEAKNFTYCVEHHGSNLYQFCGDPERELRSLRRVFRLHRNEHGHQITNRGKFLFAWAITATVADSTYRPMPLTGSSYKNQFKSTNDKMAKHNATQPRARLRDFLYVPKCGQRV